MKVLLVSPLPPPVGGMATWTQMYNLFCKENDFECVIINTALIGSRRKNLKSKRNIVDEIKRTRTIICDLIAQMDAFRPDIVHINTPCSKYGLLRDALCVWKVRKCSAKIVLHCHCTIQDMLGSSCFGKKLFSWISNHADCVFTLNSSSTDFAKAVTDDDHVKQVPNFYKAKADCPPITILDSANNIFYVGHVRAAKGMKELSEVAKEFPEKTFHVIGPIFDDVRMWAWPPNVVLYGELPHEQVLKHLAKADLFIFPSHSEGFSMAMLEAMYIGIPIIASDVGSNREMIEDMGGIVVSPGDTYGFIKGLRQLESKACREAMSRWNYQRVRKEYMPDAVLKKIFSIYKQLL